MLCINIVLYIEKKFIRVFCVYNLLNFGLIMYKCIFYDGDCCFFFLKVIDLIGLIRKI